MLKYFQELIMIREIVRPRNNNLTIQIPDEYIGQEVEYIIFPIRHPRHNKTNTKIDLDSVGGSLHHYADPDKIKLEESAWQQHVMDKFS